MTSKFRQMITEDLISGEAHKTLDRIHALKDKIMVTVALSKRSNANDKADALSALTQALREVLHTMYHDPDMREFVIGITCELLSKEDDNDK